MRHWINAAVGKIEADFQRSAETHMIRVELPALRGLDLYLKDESTHPTGSLKHRLARSLFLYGLCNGSIVEGTTIIEASSGSTAVSEAYFAQLIGVPFVAVIPKATSPQKIDQIAFYGGTCKLDDSGNLPAEAKRLAREMNGHFMDQFTYAERVTDWRGNNNIAESIFEQMRAEACPIPEWIVVSAGTGGTSATIGRFLRYKHLDSQLCVADPENSVFYDYFHSGDAGIEVDIAPRIEGIGRPRVVASFVPGVIDRMIQVPDAASLATIHFLEKILNRRCGGSTGTNVYAAFQILSELAQSGRAGSVVSMICDSGERYLDSYYDDAWLATNGFDLSPYIARLERFYESGRLAD